MAAVRLPRFARAKEIRSIRVTARDFDIIRQVSRYRFLRSSHILRLLGGSSQQILRRLQLLYHHGLLERPRAQIDYFHRSGSEPMVYGLGSKGAALLGETGTGDKESLNWSWKNQSLGRLFLRHALLVADVVVAFELASRARSGIRLASLREIQPSSTGRRRPLLWRVRLDNRVTVGIQPDQAFALESSADERKQNCAYFFLEADRGTMPIRRPDLRRSSFCRKLLAYHATWRQGIHSSKLGLPRFRVLTVTTSAERMQNMIRACQEFDGGRGLFLFAEATSLLSSDPLNFTWTSGHGRSIGLLDGLPV